MRCAALALDHKTMRCAALALMIVLHLSSASGRADEVSAQTYQTYQKAAWAVDPARPGPALPPAGRSLFDFVAADDIPFPFEALVRKVELLAGCTTGSCVTPVLIPLGRSLQRMAATPHFFRFPRAVAAVTGEDEGPMFARDRLYLAYQEKMNLIEVISYNEEAARFEFQIVRDYRQGGVPKVLYANRNVCIACHQNHAPIFSRPVWDETNANPGIAEKLLQSRKRFYGTPVQRGVDFPNMIDDATSRANLIGVTQVIWREACDTNCRALAITAAVQYRLSGGRIFDVHDLAQALSAGFAARWPNGLAIPNPDIPNRDPLSFLSAEQEPDVPNQALLNITTAFDPLAPRVPLEIWMADDPLLARRFLTGLADLVAQKDMRDLEALLARLATNATRRTYTAPCTFSGTGYECAGEFTLRGGAASTGDLAFPGEQPLFFLLKDGIATHRGLRARTTDGNLIERVAVTHESGKAKAIVEIVEDFAYVREMVRQFTWSEGPVSRRHIRTAFGLDTRDTCCGSPVLMTPVQAEQEPLDPIPEPGTSFEKACGACHRTAGRFPPNFLSGDEGQVSTNLAHCAPRIFVRLSMWEIPEAYRDKIPMPPPLASRKGSPWVQAIPPASVALLRARVAEWLREETGSRPDAAAMMAQGYENLRPCLPPITLPRDQQDQKGDKKQPETAEILDPRTEEKPSRERN